MGNQPAPESAGRVIKSGVTEFVHICERCGTQMEEQKCKIVCKNCGQYRDCSDP